MADKPVVSIVVVNWNVRELLLACIDSVYRETTMPTDAFEIVVVDNDSADGSVGALLDRFPAVRCVANGENVGFARANNQALEYCRADLILLLNPDTEVRDHAVDRMIAHMTAHPDVAALGCRLVNPDGSLQRWTAGRFPSAWTLAYHYLFANYLLGRHGPGSSLYLNYDVDRDLDVDWVSGACLMIRREAIPGTLFDESFFMYGEDMELCWRLRLAGRRVVYMPAATVLHHHGQSLKRAAPKVSENAVRGLRRFLMRTQGRGAVVMHDLITIAGFTLRWIAFSLAALARRDGGARAKALSSRRYAAVALRLMIREKP